MSFWTAAHPEETTDQSRTSESNSRANKFGYRVVYIQPENEDHKTLVYSPIINVHGHGSSGSSCWNDITLNTLLNSSLNNNYDATKWFYYEYQRSQGFQGITRILYTAMWKSAWYQAHF